MIKGKSLKENTIEQLKIHGFRLSKGLGQNFLIDEDILTGILDGAEIGSEDSVLEIGPGFGVLTTGLCSRAKKVVSVELDNRMFEILKVNLSGFSNFELIEGDILQIDIKNILEEKLDGKNTKVVANLPYYITTPIIMKLLEERHEFKSITVMVQKEVANRLCADPGCKEYGAITVSVNYYSTVRKILDVPAASFIPPPDVESTVIRFDIREKPPVELIDEALFFKVIKAAFGQRRKTLLNAISAGGFCENKEKVKEILDECGINGIRRGETLSIEEFALLANTIRGVRV